MPSRRDAEAVQVISKLLSDKVWEAAALNIGAAAQTVSSREWAGKLHGLWEALPTVVSMAPEFCRPAAWIAFRVCDWDGLEHTVQHVTDERLNAFRAVLAAQRGQWSEVLHWAGETPPGTPEKAVAARFEAAALAELRLGRRLIRQRQSWHRAVTGA